MSDMAVLGPSINGAWVQMAKHVAMLFPDGSLDPDEVMEVRCFRNKRIGPRAFFHDHGTLIRDVMKWATAPEMDVAVGTGRCSGASEPLASSALGRAS